MAPVVPVAPAVVCRSVISADCARSAAGLAQLPSAWIQPPAGFRLAEFFASGVASGAAARTEVLFLPNGGGSAQITLESADQMRPRFAAAQTLTAGPNTGVLSELTVAGAVVEAQLIWTHSGHSYSLLWIADRVDSNALIAAWNQVRYAYPSKH